MATSVAPLALIRVLSPIDGSIVGEVPDEGPAGVDAAFDRARAAAPGWASLPVSERSEALKKWRDAILDDPGVIATLVRESGKPRHEAESVELLYFCEVVRFCCSSAKRALRREVRRPFLMQTKRTLLVKKPLGVVGVIGPWNFPILNNAADAVAPLVAGNAVILKPSEVTPLTSVRLAELWKAAGNPPGVFQVVTGRGEAGARVTELSDGVIFTGSVATGRRVASRCGERLIPCVTELGGKSPFVVLSGADLDRAARAAAWSSFFHSGQACIRTERIIVEEPIADEFERRFVDRVKALRQARASAGLESEHDLGSVTFPRQIEIVASQLQDAIKKGAKLVSGGKAREDLGKSFFEPTVVLGATSGMELTREETFGPLVGVMRVRSEEEALAAANDTHLGLNATVFGPTDKAKRFAERLQTGNAIVNDVLVNYLVVEAPLGGVKASGVGVRHGVEGIRQWTRTESLTVPFAPLAPIGNLIARHLSFPYDMKVLGLIRRATRVLYGRGLKRKLGPLPG